MRNQKQLDVGDIVRVVPSFLGKPENSLGFVYETYKDFDDSSKKGVSIILENGADLGGFSYREQTDWVRFVRNSGIGYRFRNVIQLGNDFEKIIKPAF